jgi:hypothetical protein
VQVQRDAALRQIDDGGELAPTMRSTPRAERATFLKSSANGRIGDLGMGMASQHEMPADIPSCLSYFASRTAIT